jgi:hypothetical protein
MIVAMRVIKSVGCLAAAGAVFVIATASAAPQPADSGVRGLVLLGPTCPVQRPGHTCVRPYKALISIRREPGNKVVARVRSKSDGRFTVSLRGGHYLLQPRNGTPFPRAQSQTITVQGGHFTAVTIRFDSGIR